jgi:hypothetical protein
VSALATQLTAEFGEGFGRRNLFRMVRFAELFPDAKIVAALLTQLGWMHFTHIIRLEDTLKREFYAEMCRIERWSTRALEQKIQSMLFERTALSKKPEKLARRQLAVLREHNRVSPGLDVNRPVAAATLVVRRVHRREYGRRRREDGRSHPGRIDSRDPTRERNPAIRRSVNPQGCSRFVQVGVEPEIFLSFKFRRSLRIGNYRNNCDPRAGAGIDVSEFPRHPNGPTRRRRSCEQKTAATPHPLP